MIKIKNYLSSQQYDNDKDKDTPCETFMPWLQKLIFLVDSDTTSYSIHDLSTLDKDTVMMIYVNLKHIYIINFLQVNYANINHCYQ